MREYETTYILNQVINDSDVNQSIEKIGDIVKRHGGIVFKSQNMGRKQLSYRLKRQSKGIYAYLDYCGDNASVAEIERYLKLNESVIRYLTVKIADSVEPEARKKELAEEALKLQKAMAAAAAREIVEEKSLDEETEEV